MRCSWLVQGVSYDSVCLSYVFVAYDLITQQYAFITILVEVMVVGGFVLTFGV